MLSTGEDLPPGQSILARILSVEVDRSKLYLPKITEAQKQTGRLPHAMAGYLAWLAPQLDELSRTLPEQWREHRASFTEKAVHLRRPGLAEIGGRCEEKEKVREDVLTPFGARLLSAPACSGRSGGA
jgi:hypothetical protein